MPRLSDHGEEFRDAPSIYGSKDSERGVDPERLDMFSAGLDGRVAEMFALCVNDKPIRGRNAQALLIHIRALKVFVEKFEAEVEAAA